MNYNKSQQQAIRHKDGPMLVLAGPGSGKTAVITQRTKQLIEYENIDPSNILVITFTRAAAQEMKQRFLAATGEERTKVTFGTFHAIFFMVLKLAYHFDSGNIISEEQRYQFMREILSYHHLEYRDEGEFIGDVLTEISRVKNEQIPLEHFYSSSCGEEVFRKIYREYDERLKRNRLIDFDDMLTYTYELFSQRKDILSAWQKKYRYILIDEFQDINLIQWKIMCMLAAPENNLFVVGDDDQSIYRFRGAKPEIMLGFEKDFPGTKRVLLGTNYRSTKEIVETSLKLIGHNKVRFEKKLEPFRGSGRPVDFRVFDNPGHEMDTVAQSIRAYHDAGYAWNEIAVLFRTGANSGLMAERLMGYNIPFQLRDVIPNLYSHWIAKDLFAYMEIAAGSRKRSDFYRIMNRPNRYFSRDAFDTPTVSFDRLKSFYQDRDWMEDRICDLEADLRAMSRLKPVAAVNYIRKVIGYDDYLRSYAEFRRMKPEELFETADKLAESAAEFETFEAWKEHAVRYEEELKKQNLEGTREAKDRVTLSTMHSAKGLEYPVVFVVDVNEGIVPHHKAGLPADIEEERRLFYVALTRAKDRLHVAAVRERYHRKTDVSRFIGEAGL